MKDFTVEFTTKYNNLIILNQAIKNNLHLSSMYEQEKYLIKVLIYKEF